jgi:signal transduction histidine kinase
VNEWVLFELDLDYARTNWIPQLMEKYLGKEMKELFVKAEVKTRSAPPEIIFSIGRSAGEIGGKVLTVPFNNMGGSPGFPGSGTLTRWVFEAQQSPGRLEALVAASRRRNLAVAMLLNALLLAAGLALVRYTRRSRLLAEAQMQFVANVSHELRTPLTVIRGAGHNLLKGVVRDPGQVEQYLQLIVKHAEQLSEMVEQVLELGRTRNKQGARFGQAVDVAKALTEAVAATAEETKECTLEVQLAPSLPAVSGDASALQRAFQNLITNAARHGGKGGWIGIMGVTDEHQEPTMIEVQVADRGAGIPPSEIGQIFEPFFRGAAAEADQVRGSGLGLSLVKEIVEDHGGTITVESNEGRGTTFTIRLPAANEETMK